MLTPSGPRQTNGTTSCFFPFASTTSDCVSAGTKPRSCVGAGFDWLTQPLCAA
jgi:hypothetical protein